MNPQAAPSASDAILDNYFDDVSAPDGAAEAADDAANDDTFGADTDCIQAGDPDSEAVWSAGHEHAAAELEREKASLHAQLPSQSPSNAPAEQPSLDHLRALYTQHAAVYRHQCSLLQQQQRVIGEQQRSVLQQHQLFLRANPGAAAQVQEQQRQMVMHHTQQLAPLQHQIQARQHAMAQIDASVKALIAAPVSAGPGPRRPPGGREVGRMEEIERGMAAPGVGPRRGEVRRGEAERGMVPPSAVTVGEIEAKLFAKSNDRASQVSDRSRQGASNTKRVPTHRLRTSRKRLESMTDRDMELVLRMHLRQLEMAVPYKDEYYCFAFKEKRSSSDIDSFDRLAEIVTGMAGVSVRGAKRSGPKGARRAEVDVSDGAVNTNLGKIHTPENMSTLATALGTLQVWNPKAPRKLVDFGRPSAIEGKGVDAFDAVGVTPSKTGPLGRVVPFAKTGKLLREDDRILVRAAVEEGYDILAQLHDVARRKASVSIDPLVKSLYAIFRLQSKAGGSDAFLVRMCGFSKGKQFVARVFAVLKPQQKHNVACCVMRNLHLLVRSDDASSSDAFWSTLTTYAREGASEPTAAVDMLRHFNDCHEDNPSTVVVALRSASGALLIYSAMQRVFGAVSQKLFEADSSTDVSSVIGSLCGSVEVSLGDIFEQTQSSAGTWQVAAMLDALAPPMYQTRLRGTLKRLSDSGVAPPPPQA